MQKIHFCLDRYILLFLSDLPTDVLLYIYIFVLYLWKRVVEKTLLVLVLITFCHIFTLNKSGTYLTEKEKGGQTHFKL